MSVFKGVIKVHAMKACDGMDVYLHSYSTSKLDED